MSDELRDSLDRLVAGLGTVGWAEPARLRRAARWRTARTMVVVPSVIVVAVALLWNLAAPGSGSPAPLSPVASPAPVKSSLPQTSRSPGPLVADGLMLNPSDAGPSYRRGSDETYGPGEYPAWMFDRGDCRGSAALHQSAYRRYAMLRIIGLDAPDLEHRTRTVSVELRVLSVADAEQVMTDVRRYVAACSRWTGGTEANSAEHPAHGIWAQDIVDDSFAGDDAVLVKIRSTSEDDTGRSVGNDVTDTTAVARVGGDIVVIDVESDTPVSGPDRDQIIDLAKKAAQKLR